MSFKKAFMLIGVLTLSFVITACGSSDSKTEEKGSSTDKKEITAKKEEKKEKITTDVLITAFKSAGLEAENPTDLPSKEFGNTRLAGKRILIPALGTDKGGRVFEFKNKDDLEKAKKYYDDLGNGNPMLFSHTYAKGNFLLQMNGDMKDDQFDKYKKVMDEKIK